MTLSPDEQRIVDWLRERGLSWRTRGEYANAYDLAANAIERGDHRQHGKGE